MDIHQLQLLVRHVPDRKRSGGRLDCPDMASASAQRFSDVGGSVLESQSDGQSASEACHYGG